MSSKKNVAISDVAKAAGLSKGAVSYALNGKPGVSEKTRARVIEIAQEMGWSPNAAARSLRSRRSSNIGLVICRPSSLLETESFYMRFIAGVEAVLSSEDLALTIQLVGSNEKEIATYEKWWSRGQVDGVILVDIRHGDKRQQALRLLGIPAVLVGDPATADGMPYVTSDDALAMREALRYLARLGHREIAHVGGDPELTHIASRQQAYVDALGEIGLSATGYEVTDFSGEAGARATRNLLTRPDVPSAIIYDNDIMAVAGLAVAAELGVKVPKELSILAWDDSSLCTVTHPPISAIHRDVVELGRTVARSLITLIRDAAVGSTTGPPLVLTPRGTTGPPRRPRSGRVGSGLH